MTKKEKFKIIDQVMTIKKRDDGTEFHCFSDKAPEDLKDLFLGSYEVRDLDYKIWHNACDIISGLEFETLKGENDDSFDIYEIVDSEASPYNSDRLEYLNIWNEEEITEKVRDNDCNISEACAYWYDEQVRDVVSIIRDWIFK